MHLLTAMNFFCIFLFCLSIASLAFVDSSERQEQVKLRLCTSVCGLRDAGTYMENTNSGNEVSAGTAPSRGSRFSILSMIDSSRRRPPNSRRRRFRSIQSSQIGKRSINNRDVTVICKICRMHGFTD